MIEIEVLLRLLLALGLGALIGAERERFARVRDDFLFGGIRTFMFISLLGALAGYVASLYFDWFIVVAFIGLVVLIAISYYTSVIISHGKSIGLTAEITALLVFFIGLMCYNGQLIIPVALSILITTILYLKEKLHSFIHKISKEEMYGTLVFAIIAFVILPFLPNQTFGPLNVFNPYKIWLMVVFISGMGYVGYILIKILGSNKGVGITGFLGGLVSSTAVTMSFASSSKKETNLKMIKLFLFATLIANAVMFIRVILEVYIVNKAILGKLIVPMTVMFLAAIISAVVYWLTRDKKNSSTKQEVAHQSPFSVGPALKFGFLFAVVLFVIKAAEIYFGNTGIYIASTISGFVDVDAITLSMASIAGNGISEKVAATAITLAVMSNMIIKYGYALLFGSKDFSKRIGYAFLFIVVSGLVSIALI